MGPVFKALLGAAALALAVASPTIGRADSGSDETGASYRELNGHIFTPSPFLSFPFSDTHLGSTTRYALAEASTARYDIHGNVIGERKYTLGAFGNEINYQLRLADWLALRVSGNALVFSGLSGASVVAIGASVRYNFGLGLTAGFQPAHSLRVAFVGDAGFQPAFDISVASGLLAAIQSGEFNSNAVFVTGKTFQLRPGVSLAWAPHRVIGFTGEVRYVNTQVNRSSSENATGDAMEYDALLDVDLGRVTPVPIALTGLYRLQDPLSGGKPFRIENAGAGIFYTGRPHLAAGVALTQQWFQVRPRINTTGTLTDLMVRYYW